MRSVVRSIGEARDPNDGTALFEHLVEAVGCYRTDGTIVYVNPVACRVLGRSREALVGQNLWDVAPEAREGPFRVAFEQVVRSGAGQPLETFHARGTRWFSIRIYLADEKIWVLGRDVTAEKASTARIEILADTIMSNATLGLLMTDDRQHCTFMNPAAERITGFRLDELRGKPLHHFIHHSHSDGTPHPMEACPINRALPTKNQQRGEDTFIHKDGHFYPVAFTASPILEGVQSVGTVIELRDTTEEKAAQRERERILADLRAAVAARDEFLSIASHELRTPLTSLELHLANIRRSLLKEPAEQVIAKLGRRIESVTRQADRLTALIDGLLNVSRIELGRLHIEPAALDVADLVREVVERSQADAARVGSLIATHLPPQGATVWADRMRIDQALTNLLSNAIKYGAGKPIEVRLAADGERLSLAVRDEGMGIAPQDLARIFGRFERAVASTHYGGLGLGLYIANQIVIAHGGTIDADSEPGKGATFTIRLPLGLADPSP